MKRFVSLFIAALLFIMPTFAVIPVTIDIFGYTCTVPFNKETYPKEWETFAEDVDTSLDAFTATFEYNYLVFCTSPAQDFYWIVGFKTKKAAIEFCSIYRNAVNSFPRNFDEVWNAVPKYYKSWDTFSKTGGGLLRFCSNALENEE